MAQSDGLVQPGSDKHTEGTTPRKRRFPRWLKWTASIAFILLAVATVIVMYVVHNAEPILRRRVIASLEARFDSPVELDEFHISVLRGLEVSGGGLKIFYFGEKDTPEARADDIAPMLAVRNFEFHTGLRELFQPIMHISLVRVQGIALRIPPSQQRAPVLPRTNKEERKDEKEKRSILLDTIVCSDMTLTIETDKPGKLPLVFDISNVVLHDSGPGKSLPFDAWLVNPVPLGNIHSTGHFGPWRADDPRETPLDGTYSFTHADLGTIPGISGILSSTGQYGGSLDEIGVTGTTETPNFALDSSERSVDLHTQFDAVVDGTTGDTRLNSVHATFLHTAIDVSGMVTTPAGDRRLKTEDPTSPPHFLNLTVAAERARIEDLLCIGIKNNPPLMSGALALHAHLNMAPGHTSVTQRMRLQGTFAIHDATFSNSQWQQTVDVLSERASGNPEQANAANAVRVTSGMGGTFTLADAMLNMEKLNYSMPGAQVDLTGKYSLDGDTFDFAGTVRTKATASQMLTGWKSLLAMPLDRFFKKDGAGLEVPVKISGTKSAPKFGLDLDKMFSHHSKDTPAANQQPAQPQ